MDHLASETCPKIAQTIEAQFKELLSRRQAGLSGGAFTSAPVAPPMSVPPQSSHINMLNTILKYIKWVTAVVVIVAIIAVIYYITKRYFNPSPVQQTVAAIGNKYGHDHIPPPPNHEEPVSDVDSLLDEDDEEPMINEDPNFTLLGDL